MANPLDTDAGSELFASYEAELKLVQADLTQQLDQIPELSGEPRKAAVRQAERALEEANELPSQTPLCPQQQQRHANVDGTIQLDQMRIEKQNIPASTRTKTNQRFRNFETDVDVAKRKLKSLSDDRSALFGSRYSDNPNGVDANLEQRQQLLSGTERLDRSSQRLKDSHRIALETEDIGRNTLADLTGQRETILHTHANLQQSEGYVDTSINRLRGMARR
ncbi:MAG: hypothetical protein M1819_002194 [Sarea resinae]|nr:MAG: hypothetical protein M1819_002194 [Sarea resinae]